MNRAALCIALITGLSIAGCSSSEDNPPLNDAGTTTGDGTTSGNLISLDQDNEILQTAVTVASLKVMNELNDFALTIQFSDRNEEACVDGGTKTFADRSNGGCVRCQVIVDVDLDNCAIDGQTLDGQIALIPLTSGRDRRYSSISYENQSGDTVNLTGDYSAFPSENEYENSFNHIWEIDALEYAGDESIDVSNLYAEFTTVPSLIDTEMRDVVEYRASFGFSGEATENLNYEFSTINVLESASDSPYYDSGIFRIQSDSSSSLDVNFGTGNPATLLLILQNETGSEDSSQDIADSLDKLYFSVSNQL